MTRVRIPAIALTVAFAAGACGGGGADQGTVRTCFGTIGVKEPDAQELGSVQGWMNVAAQAIAEAKDPGVRTAGDALAAALSRQVQADGFDDADKARYKAAVTQMLTACKDADAFKGDPRK